MAVDSATSSNFHDTQPVPTTEDAQSTQQTQQTAPTPGPQGADQAAQVVAAVLTGGLSALFGAIFGAKPQTQMQQPPPAPAAGSQQQAATGYAAPPPPPRNDADDWTQISRLSAQLNAELAKGNKADQKIVANLQQQIKDIEQRHEQPRVNLPPGTNVHADGTDRPRTPQTDGTPSPGTDNDGDDAGATTTPVEPKAAGSTSSDPLEDARDRIDDAKQDIDSQIDTKTAALAAEVAKGDKANQATISKLNRDIQKLTNTETSLTQLSNQLEQMLQNIANMRHETAMNAIHHIQ